MGIFSIIIITRGPGYLPADLNQFQVFVPQDTVSFPAQRLAHLTVIRGVHIRLFFQTPIIPLFPVILHGYTAGCQLVIFPDQILFLSVKIQLLLGIILIVGNLGNIGFSDFFLKKGAVRRLKALLQAGGRLIPHLRIQLRCISLLPSCFLVRYIPVIHDLGHISHCSQPVKLTDDQVIQTFHFLFLPLCV